MLSCLATGGMQIAEPPTWSLGQLQRAHVHSLPTVKHGKQEAPGWNTTGSEGIPCRYHLVIFYKVMPNGDLREYPATPGCFKLEGSESISLSPNFKEKNATNPKCITIYANSRCDTPGRF